MRIPTYFSHAGSLIAAVVVILAAGVWLILIQPEAFVDPIGRIFRTVLRPPVDHIAAWKETAFQSFYGAWVQGFASLAAGVLAVIAGVVAFAGARYQGQRSFDAALAVISAEDERRELERAAKAGALAVTLIEDYRELRINYNASILMYRNRMRFERRTHVLANLGDYTYREPATLNLPWNDAAYLGVSGAEAIAKARGNHVYVLDTQDNLRRNSLALHEADHDPGVTNLGPYLTARKDAARMWRVAAYAAIRETTKIIEWIENEKVGADKASRILHQRIQARLSNPSNPQT